MKAAIMQGPNINPVYGDFREPTAGKDEELIHVSAAALSNFTRARATGSHYSAENAYPAVAGSDGVGKTRDGRRVYFALPEAPFGSMAEQSVARSKLCIRVPDDLDDVTAAALGNPGMSAWTGLFERARMISGETVLVNGATSTAGRLAVQLAKFRGAKKVIATGRNEAELEALKRIGADVIIPFRLSEDNPSGVKAFEEALCAELASGIDVVMDYLWGTSAQTIIIAIAKAMEDATPVRFVHLGGVSGGEIQLPGAALRSSAIQLMGSGVKSVPIKVLLASVGSVFANAKAAALEIAVQTYPLTDVERVWAQGENKPRVVFNI